MGRIVACGAIGLACVFTALVLFPVQRTSTGDWRQSHQETAALRMIQAIHTAEVQYNSQYGRYAISLQELGFSATSSDGTRLGYKFSLAGAGSGYVVNANPVTYGTDGNRTFFSDQTMVIRVNNGPEPASAVSQEFGRHR